MRILNATAAEAVVEIAAAAPGPRVGAFFDLDGTLVAGLTATAHAGDRIRRRQAGIGEVLGVVEAMMRYRLGRMEFDRLAVRGAGYLRGESPAELEQVGERLFVDRIAARYRPVAGSLGITHAACHHFEVDGRRLLTGDITRPIIWGPKNAATVQRFCTDNAVALQDSYFYADGDEDLALMSLVGHPRPVNPRPQLASMSAQRGWPVLQVSLDGQR